MQDLTLGVWGNWQASKVSETLLGLNNANQR